MFGSVGRNRLGVGPIRRNAYPLPNISLALNDLGNGAVDTAAGINVGLGAASFTRATAAACKLANGNWKLDVAAGTARSHYLLGTVPAYMQTPGGIGHYASTPDTAANSLTGNIQIIADIAPASWTPTAGQAIIAKHTSAGNQRSWIFSLEASGVLRFLYNADGSAGGNIIVSSTVATAFSAFTRAQVRCDVIVNNGFGKSSISFYTSVDAGQTWQQLGTSVLGNIFSIFDSTSNITVAGWDNGAGEANVGKVYRAYFTGTIGGVPVVDFNPALAAAIGSGSFVASTGETWTINGLAYIDANPVYGGYLAEPAATQLALNPRDMTQASWVKTSMTAAQTATGMDGVANSATTLTATGANGTAIQTLVAAASQRTYSCWIKRRTGTGTIGICQDGVTFTDVTAQVTSSQFLQVQLNASILNAAFGIRLGTNGDAIDVDCNQYEAGEVATTPIPGAGTRNADDLNYTLTGYANNLSSYCEFASITPQVYTDFPRLISVNNGTAYERTGTNIAPGTYFPAVSAHSAAVAQYNISIGPIIVKERIVQIAARHYNTGANIANTKTLGAASGATTAPIGMNALQIGSAIATQQARATIKNIKLWNYALTDAQLQQLTGP